MNEELQKKYLLLKEKNNVKVREKSWKSNLLFTECLEALHDYKIESLEESEKILTQFQKKFIMTNCGYIDWNHIDNSKIIKDVLEIKNVCDISKEYYILWDQKDIPVVSCQLSTIIDNIDDVLAVSFDTWVLSNDIIEIIEFYHEGTITYGKVID